MIYECDSCGKERKVKPVLTDGGVIRLCDWCINSGAQCPNRCKRMDKIDVDDVPYCAKCKDLNMFRGR